MNTDKNAICDKLADLRVCSVFQNVQVHWLLEPIKHACDVSEASISKAGFTTELMSIREIKKKSWRKKRREREISSVGKLVVGSMSLKGNHIFRIKKKRMCMKLLDRPTTKNRTDLSYRLAVQEVNRKHHVVSLMNSCSSNELVSKTCSALGILS